MCLSSVIGNEPFQPCILVLERSQLAQLADVQVAVLFLPDVKGGFADPSCRQTSAGGDPPSTWRRRLVNRLVELGRDFDLMFYPNRTHAMSEGPRTTLDRWRMVARYFLRHLPPDP